VTSRQIVFRANDHSPLNAEIKEETGYSPAVSIVMAPREIPLVVDAYVFVAALHV
jgi:hypothetical protein